MLSMPKRIMMGSPCLDGTAGTLSDGASGDATVDKTVRFSENTLSDSTVPSTVIPMTTSQRHAFRVSGRLLRGAAAALCLFAPAASAGAADGDIDHAAWDELLERHVEDGLVNYEGLAQEHAALDHYLAALAEADPAAVPSDAARLALWTNAYNACAVKLVLDSLPVSSVRDVRGFFDEARCRVAGRELSLREILNQGRALGDWRFLFAAACPAMSCPPARAEAYDAEWLDAQLDDQVSVFLADAQDGLRLEGNALWISPLFKTHAPDIVGRTLAADSLLAVLEPYLPPHLAGSVQGQKLKLKLMRRDWRLNAMVPYAAPGAQAAAAQAVSSVP
jgi:hypothetical protein